MAGFLHRRALKNAEVFQRGPLVFGWGMAGGGGGLRWFAVVGDGLQLLGGGGAEGGGGEGWV